MLKFSACNVKLDWHHCPKQLLNDTSGRISFFGGQLLILAQKIVMTENLTGCLSQNICYHITIQNIL